jgi:thiol-disulfide isomerase/thioredoxin
MDTDLPILHGLAMRHALALGLVAASLGCGSEPAPASPDAGTTMRGAYPAGPYGTAVDTVLANVSFIRPDGTPHSFENDVWKKPGSKLMLLVTASGWCVACIEEQPALERLHGEWASKGLVIVEALFETQDFQPATPTLASNWKRQYNLSFDVVADPPFALQAYYDRALTPMNMLVDVDTMKILRIATGWDPNATEAIIRQRLQ